MKVIATDITNLTDARYFAAWGVDILCYTIEEGASGSVTPEQLKEITEWVEGPETAIKIGGLNIPESISTLSSDLSIKKVFLSPFIEESALPDGIEEVFRICTLDDGWQDNHHLILNLNTPIANLSSKQEQKIKSISSQKEVYLDGSFVATDLDKIAALGFVGIILKGGEEEKVGYKSFEELDEVLEVIYD